MIVILDIMKHTQPGKGRKIMEKYTSRYQIRQNRKKKRKVSSRRIAIILLVVVMLIGIVQQGVLAEDETNISFYDVSLDVAGAVTSVPTQEGMAVALPHNLPGIPADSQIAGWQLNGSAYDIGTPVTESITLTAVLEKTVAADTGFEEAPPQPEPPIYEDDEPGPAEVSYTVWFWDADGKLINDGAPISVKAGEKIAEADIPFIEHKDFKCWKNTKDDSEIADLKELAITEELTLNGELTLKAVLAGEADKEIKEPQRGDEVTHDVKFVVGDASSIVSVKHNERAEEPENPEIPEGMVSFEGWFTDAAYGSKFDFDTLITSDITLYARFTAQISVTFLDMDGKAVEVKWINSGSKVGQPTWTPTAPDGKWFMYWYEADESVSFDFNESLTQSKVLKPRFDSAYYVFFNSRGSAVQSQYVLTGQRAAEPSTIPTRTGYKFAYWSLDNKTDITDKSAARFDFSTPITGTTNLYAVYDAEKVGYSIVYWVEKPNVEGDPAQIKDNYMYVYTQYKNKEQGAAAGSIVEPAGNSADVAITDAMKAASPAMKYSQFAFSKPAVIAGDGTSVVNVYYKRISYKLIFNLDPGFNKTATMIFNGAQYSSAGEKYQLNAKFEQDIENNWPSSANATFSHSSGSKFMYWSNKNVSNSNRLVSKRFTLTSDLIPISGNSITYSAGWGTTHSAVVEYWLESLPGEAGEKKTFGKIERSFTKNAALSQDILLEGDLSAKSLEGMTYVGAGGQYDSTTSLYQFYYSRNKFTLFFNMMGGNAAGSISSVMYGTKLSQISLPKPERNGYDFVGWYYDADYNIPVKFDDAAMPNSDLGLFAKWEANKYHASFYSTLADKEAKVVVGMAEGEGLTFEKGGYTLGEAVQGLGVFLGWYWYDGSGRFVQFDFGNYTANGDVTLYGNWKTDGFKVIYNNGDSTGMPPKDTAPLGYDLGNAAPVQGMGTLEKENHTFIGWQVNGTGKVYYPGGSIKVDGANNPINLYPYFIANAAGTVNITYYSNYNDSNGQEEYYTHKTGKNLQFDLYDGSKFKRAGYELYGWKQGEAEFALDAKHTADADCAFYANWKKLDYKTVTFNVENGKFGAEVTKTEYSDVLPGVSLNEFLNKISFNQGVSGLASFSVQPDEGYKFEGEWTYSPAKPLLIQTDLVITAKCVPVTHEVVFKNWDGKEISKQSYRHNSELQVPDTEPVRPQTQKYTYKFSGWTPELVTPVTGDAVYTAEYAEQLRKYTIKFDTDGNGYLDGEKETVNKELEYGALVGALPSPAGKEGYYFHEWYPAVTAEAIVENDATYTARFLKKQDITTAQFDLESTEGEYTANMYYPMLTDTLGLSITYEVSTTGAPDSYMVWGAEMPGRTNVGKVYVKATAGGEGTIYNLAERYATIEVTKAPLCVTAKDADVFFGMDLSGLMIEPITGFKKDETQEALVDEGALSFTTDPLYVPGETAAGTPNIKIWPLGLEERSGNYYFDYRPGILTVNQSAAEGELIAVNKITTYTGLAEHSIDVDNKTGQEPRFYTSADGIIWNEAPQLENPKYKDAGIYYVKVAVGGENTNYKYKEAVAQVEIERAKLTATASNAYVTFGLSLPSSALSLKSIEGFVNGESEQEIVDKRALAFDIEPAYVAGVTAAGTSGITINAKGLEDVSGNYYFSYRPGVLTVGAQTIGTQQFSLESVIAEYNADMHYPQLTNTLGLAINYEVSTTGEPGSYTAWSGGIPGRMNVGRVYVKATAGGAGTNYDLAERYATIEVTKAPLNVTVNDASVQFGEELDGLSIKPITGFKKNETQTVIVDESAIAFAVDPQYIAGVTAAGTPNIKILASGLVDRSGNYEFNYEPGNLEVKPVQTPVTITIDEKQKVYGAQDEALTATVKGAPASAIRFRLSRAEGEDAGSYAITADVAKNTNYSNIIVENANYTITKAPLTATAGTYVVTQGATPPEYGVSYSGFVRGDTEASLARPAAATSDYTPASPAGTYAVVASGAAAKNYDISYVNGSILVNPAAVPVLTVDYLTAPYSGAAYTIGARLTDAGGEEITAAIEYEMADGTWTTARPTAVDVADSRDTIIARANVDGSTVYGVGGIVVTPLEATVTAASATKAAGEADPVLTAAAAGFLPGQTPAYTVSRVAGEAVGTYAINVTLRGGTENYNVRAVPGTLTITAAAAAATAATAATTTPPAPPTVNLPDQQTPLAGGPAANQGGAEGTDLVTLDENEVPLAAKTPEWALLNLLLAISTGIIMLVLVIGYFAGKKNKRKAADVERRNPAELKRKGIMRLASIIATAAAVIVFILTEDMRNTMIFVDQWTVWMAVIAAVQVAVAVFSKKGRKKNENKMDTANAQHA